MEESKKLKSFDLNNQVLGPKNTYFKNGLVK